MSFLLGLFNFQPSKHLKIQIIQLGLMRLTQSKVMCIKVKGRRPWYYAFLGGYGVFNINIYYWTVWRRSQSVPFHQHSLLPTWLQRSSLEESGMWKVVCERTAICQCKSEGSISHTNLRPCWHLQLLALFRFVPLNIKLLVNDFPFASIYQLIAWGKTLWISKMTSTKHHHRLYCGP